MVRRVDPPSRPGLADYEAVGCLSGAVRELRTHGEWVARRMRGRTVWMVNSTARGGGVAEMLPSEVALLRELGIATEWVVLESDEPDFFVLTKHIHNLIHGVATAVPGACDRKLYERVNRANADQLAGQLRPGDILIVHDPQPLPLAGLLREAGLDFIALWRCHIGLDRENDATRAVWKFIQPYTTAYDRTIFSAPEYVPDWLRSRALVIHPAIDPLSPKNRGLSLHTIIQILVNAGLAAAPGPVLTRPFEHRATRLRADGSFVLANGDGDIGLLTRPIVTQVSRWDRLKGWAPLVTAFAELKEGHAESHGEEPLDPRRIDLARLVLAGPAPSAVDDDPEGKEVLAELMELYRSLPAAVQEDVVLLSLPMENPEQNASMVNALQRASSVVVQNSIREGFGLTVTEAMWKHVPVLTNRQACGPRHQVRDSIDGCVIGDPENVEELAAGLDAMLASPDRREYWGRNAQRHVHERFLIFTPLREWLDLLSELSEAPREGGAK